MTEQTNTGLNMKTIDERIQAIEDKLYNGRVPGTTITRTLDKDGYRWSISIGLLEKPKDHFYGFKSIEEAISHVEMLIANESESSMKEIDTSLQYVQMIKSLNNQDLQTKLYSQS